MKQSNGIWRRRLWLWLPALVLVILNLAVLSTYRFLLAGQAQLRSMRVERMEREVIGFEADRAAIEALVAQAKLNRERVAEFFARWVGTEAELLTDVIAEVKDLAGRAGVDSSSFQYPEEELSDYDLRRRSIAFTVTGSYSELRQFINLIELSDYFLMLEDVRLNETGQGESMIRVRLRVSTLFRQQPEPSQTADAADPEVST